MKSRAPRQAPIAAAGLLALGLLFGVLHRLGDLKLYVVEVIAVGLAAGIVYFLALYGLHRTPDTRAAFWLVLAGALIFRLQLLPLAPALSDDLLRYRWDARVQEAGWNPYAVRPDDPRLTPLRDASWSRIPGRDIPAVYPPLSELLYRATWRLLPKAPGKATLIWFKLPFVAADLLIVAMLAGWIRATGGRNLQLAVYAWNPLVVVEFAASGHNDALAAAAVLAATLVIIRGRATLSTLLLAAAALLKVFPTVLFPVWLRRAGWPRTARGWWNALAVVALAAVCAWPFRSAWPGIFDVLRYYQSRWRHNNASLYALIAGATGSPDVSIGIGVGVVAGLALWAAVRRLDAARAAYILFGAILMLTPNAFPWYFTWIVPLLSFFPNPAWLLLTVLQFLSYHVLIDYEASGLWRFRPEMLWLTYAPFYGLLVWQLARQRHLFEEAKPTPGAPG